VFKFTDLHRNPNFLQNPATIKALRKTHNEYTAGTVKKKTEVNAALN